MAVSHSSHLDTPPARPASSVWTVHDSSWSAEAMMIKKDLPGRTLDFTFDLSATPVIGRRATPEISGEMCRENKLLSQVSTVDLSTWKKPYLSQVHVIRCNCFYRKRAISKEPIFFVKRRNTKWCYPSSSSILLDGAKPFIWIHIPVSLSKFEP